MLLTVSEVAPQLAGCHLDFQPAFYLVDAALIALILPSAKMCRSSRAAPV